MPLNKKVGRYNPNVSRIRFKLISFIIFSTIIALLIDASVRPYIRSMAATSAENISMQAISEAVEEILSAENIDYDDLAIVETNNNGDISSIKINTIKANILKSKINKRIQEKVSVIEGYNMRIPIGSVFGNEYLAGWGPHVGIKLTMRGAATSKINNAFESAGINQTLHRIMLDVTTKIYIVLPRNTSTTSLTTNVCIAETIIVGAVPDMMVQINPNVVEQK